MTATLKARTEEVNPGNTRFDGDPRSTIIHHTIELGQNQGSESITNNAQSEVGLPKNGHKTKGNGRNNQESVGSKDLFFFTQAHRI